MPDAPPDSDPFADWAARIAAGDRAALGLLFDATYAPLLATARRYAADDPAAEDAVQDAFVALWERRSRLDPARSLRALLTVSVRHRLLNDARDAARRRELRDALPELAGPDRPDGLTAAALLAERVEGWIGELPPRRREAFWLSRHGGLSYAEIAGETGTSVKTVENHVGAALRHLRDRLARVAPDSLPRTGGALR